MVALSLPRRLDRSRHVGPDSGRMAATRITDAFSQEPTFACLMLILALEATRRPDQSKTSGYSKLDVDLCSVLAFQGRLPECK
jgi:hypothetical protein